MLYSAGLKVLSLLARVIFRIRLEGGERLPTAGPVLILSNHRSVCDPLFLAMGCRRKIRFMAKSELFEDHGALARSLLYRLGAFPVRRGTGDLKSLREALALLSDGAVVGIFPQGRCVPDSEPFHAMPGAAFLALRSGAPVVPACIRCRGNVRPGKRITVRFGEPIVFQAKRCGKKEAADASEQITAQIRRLLEDPC